MGKDVGTAIVDAARASDLNTLTHNVTRVSTGGPLRVFFNALGRGLEWNPADAAEEPGSPQDVPAVVVDVITADPGLAPHFRCERSAPATEGRAKASRKPAE